MRSIRLTPPRSIVLLLGLTLAGPVSRAAAPPDYVNYQGVLRDAGGNPVTNPAQAMRFTFWDGSAAGTEIMRDRHDGPTAVPVEDGMFSVWLGGGVVTDGPGPGVYTSLGQVFRDHGEVWMEVMIGAEVMSPRVRVVASPYAHNAAHLDGRSAAEFVDTSGAAQVKTGKLEVHDGSGAVDYCFEASGRRGAYISDTDNSGYARVADGDYGILGYGNFGGGYFKDLDNGGYAYVGRSSYGIMGYGETAGGYFKDASASGYANIGSGDYGLNAFGNTAGANFQNLTNGAYVELATGTTGTGITAYGASHGGYFENTIGGTYARLAYRALGLGYGIFARGTFAGGNFGDLDGSGRASVGFGEIGIQASGDLRGGDFTDNTSGNYGYVGAGSYKVIGTGSVSFVQNHPYDADRVIVYHAPESDEVATYHRGSGVLVGGEARVPLGDTFAWVTNPDIGLSAHVTPVGNWAELYVASRSTEELVVRSRDPEASDIAFDFIVYGLRIGFEESSVVQEKQAESFIPSMKDHRALYEREPALRAHSALERFRAQEIRLRGIDAPLDLSRAEALRAAIQEYDPEIHGPVSELRGHTSKQRVEAAAGAGSVGGATRPALPAAGNAETAAAGRESDDLAPAVAAAPASGAVGDAPDGTDLLLPRLAVRVDVAPGDVLADDPAAPGTFRPADAIADPTVLGVALSGPVDGLAGVATYGVTACKVDAGYGAIRIGDLLTTSPTDGHAMRALDLLPGTILGKALQPLDTGTGTIRVLVMPR